MMVRVEGKTYVQSDMVAMSINPEFVSSIIWRVEPPSEKLCLVWLGTGNSSVGIFMNFDDAKRVEQAVDEVKKVAVEEVIVTR